MAVKRYLNETGLARFFNNLKTFFSGTATPTMNGVASVGSSNKLAHEDHVHPSDTSKVDLTYLEQNYLSEQAIEDYLDDNYYSKAEIDSNLSTNYLTASAADIRYATITDMAAANAKIGTIESDYIKSTTIDAAVADVGYLKANSADVNYVKVSKANITEAWIKDLLVQGSVIAQNGTFYELTGLHIDANDITAGTLTVDRLQLLGSDGLYYALNFNSMGETEFEQLSEEDQLACQSQIHAKTIVANSITTDQITVNNLVGTGGWINLANGTFSYTNATSGNGISWDGTNLTISTDSISMVSTGRTLTQEIANAKSEAISTASTDATSKANAAQSAAISAAATDATSKANAAEANAKGYVDDELTAYSTTAEMTSAISQSASSITSTVATTYATKSNAVKSSIQLWYSKANTTAPNKPTAKVTSTSTNGNAWRTVVPAYNASYPNYYYCWQYEYVDGSFSWSDVVRDIAMGETQSTARTASSNASTALTNAATAQSTADTASSNASTALTNAAAAQTTADTANGTANTALANAAAAQSTADTASSNASTALSNAASAQTAANTALADSVEYIVGTHGSTATNAWTGTTRDASLAAGKTIAFKMTSAGNSSAATLNLTLSGGGTTGAKALRRNDSTVTTQFAANSILNMTYDGTYWRITGLGSDTNTYDRTRYSASVTAAAAIAAGRIGVFGTDGKLKLLADSAFDMTLPILYVGTAYTASALTQTDNYTMFGRPFALTNTHAITGAAAGKSVYIVGSLSGTIFTPNSSVLTCTVPTTADGLYYLKLGMMSTAANAVLDAEHPLYAYIEGEFQRVDLGARSEISQLSDQIVLKVNSNGRLVSVALDASASTGSALTLSADNINLSGYVTASSLTSSGTTVIDGGRITTGTISANRIAANSIAVSKLTGSISNGNWKIDLDNGTFTIGEIAAEKITSGYIDAARINSESITIGKLDTSTQNSIANGAAAYERKTMNYGSCGTAAGTAAKVVATAGFESANLVVGAAIAVRFATANTSAAAITLNVNSTGAKTIRVGANATSATNQLLWIAGAVITFVYDGTYWVVADNPGSYKCGACTIAAGTAAKTATVTNAYPVIFAGVKVTVTMNNANTNTSATLNISSTGAKAIYYGTTTTRPTTANGRGWIAGMTVTFQFDGAYWRLDEPGTIINGDHITTGSINADLITTGHMSANHISGGELTLGGDNNINGLLRILDASGNVVGTLDKDGLTTSSANITGGSIAVTADTGSTALIKVIYGNDPNSSTYKELDLFPAGIRTVGEVHTLIQNGYVDLMYGGLRSNARLQCDTTGGFLVLTDINGTKTIKITPDSNVATLSYTVVSTF